MVAFPSEMASDQAEHGVTAMIEERPGLAIIQGDIQRKAEAADVAMTETRYRPDTRLNPHTHQQRCFGFILQGEYAEAFRHHEFVCGPRMVVLRPPLGRGGARALFLEVSDRRLHHVREYSSILVQPTLLRPSVSLWF